MRSITFLFVALFAFSTVSTLPGEEQAVADSPEPEISIGEMRIQTIPPMSYLCTPAETTFATMREPVRSGFDRAFRAAAEAKLLIARPTMLVYEGNPHVHYHPQKSFKMEIGVIVADDSKIDAFDDLRIRKTEPFKCATILYTGTVRGQGKAWQKLIPAMTAAGLKPTGEEREMCLYWEGLESSSNVYMMMAGIE